jgi:hypothetical protein
MKNIVHLFSREVVSKFLELNGGFEFIAALMMQRLYEEQWRAPTMISFYITAKYTDLLKERENPDRNLLMAALANGIKEDHQIDFVIASEDERSCQEFQLKRFGLGDRQSTTEGLVAYLNEMERRYTPIDAACLVAIKRIDLIDLPRVRAEVKRKAFPFSELLLIGVVADKFLVAGILPEEGWSAYDLSAVVH